MSPRPLFLERSSYRRRRLGDAARILPVLALVLLFVPVWWFPERISLTGGALWLFGLWAALIGLIGALHLALGWAERAERPAQDAEDEERTDHDGQERASLPSAADDEVRDAR